MSKIVEQLTEIKETIENAKNKKLTIQGKMESITDRLKTEFNCSTVEEAEKLLTSLQKEIKADSEELETAVQNLHDAFEWDSI